MDSCRLTTSHLDLALDACGYLTRLTAPNQGWVYLQASVGTALPVFQIWTDGSDQTPLPEWHLQSRGSGANSLLLQGANTGVAIALDIVSQGSACAWQFRIANRGRETVQRLRFQIASPEVGAGARITYPFNSGWCVPVASLGHDEVLSIHYPVHACMQWVDLYDAERGLYLGVHDAQCLHKTLLLGRQRGRPYLAWEFSDLALAPGDELALPPIHLALHSGDWQSGADMYRSWARQHIADPDVPAWYANLPAWNWTGLRGQHERVPWLMCADLPGVSQRSAELGVSLIQMTAYTEHGHDTQFPDYVVGPSYGGERALRHAVDTIHAQGRRFSMYTNARIVDPDSSLSSTQRDSWGVRATKHGDVWHEVYGSVTFDVMCPAAAEWADLFTRRLAYLVERYDVDGIYLDQVCGCTSLPCYAAGHSHQRPNEAWAAYLPFLRVLRSTLRALKPDLFLATEGVNDVFGQYFDSQQSHEDWARAMEGRGILLPELYRYTFPGHPLNVGCIRANNPFFVRLAHTVASGFDFGIDEFDGLSPSFVRATRWALGQRQSNAAFLRRAAFHPQVSADNEHYHANAFSAGDMLLIAGAWLGGDDSRPRAVQMAAPWPFAHPLAVGECETPDGAVPCQVDVSAGEVRVVVPGHDMALVHLTERS